MTERKKRTISGRLLTLSALALASAVGDIDSSHGFGSPEESDGLPVPRHARKARIAKLLKDAEDKLAAPAKETDAP